MVPYVVVLTGELMGEADWLDFHSPGRLAATMGARLEQDHWPRLIPPPQVCYVAPLRAALPPPHGRWSAAWPGHMRLPCPYEAKGGWAEAARDDVVVS